MEQGRFGMCYVAVIDSMILALGLSAHSQYTKTG